VYKILVVEPEWKISFGRQGHRWDDNIKIHFKETGPEDMA